MDQKPSALIAVVFLFVFCVVSSSIVTASVAHAQWRGGDREDMERWREYWEQTEEGEIDDDEWEEMRNRRQQSSAIRDAIDELDDDPVEDLPVPILFGVSLDDITPNFGDPRDGGARLHEGLDMLAPEGTPIVSPTEAVVIRVGSGSSSGKYVTTANPGGETFVYMHLSDVADLDEGDMLAVGDVIGYMGNTGNASGGPAHLHFEIREDRREMDPFPRLTEDFSLEERMEFLEDILDDVNDEDELAEMLVGSFLHVFVQARAQNIDLPDAIVDALPSGIATGDVPLRDLDIGSEGADVLVLQSILIAEGHLSIGTPTNYFGPLTQAALVAYQQANGIQPSSGYYGPITRAHMNGGVSSDSTSGLSRAEMIERIAELTERIQQLQAILAEREV